MDYLGNRNIKLEEPTCHSDSAGVLREKCVKLKIIGMYECIECGLLGLVISRYEVSLIRAMCSRCNKETAQRPASMWPGHRWKFRSRPRLIEDYRGIEASFNGLRPKEIKLGVKRLIGR